METGGMRCAFPPTLAKNRQPKINTPIATPTQKPQKSFLAWRLPVGEINATENQLENASSSCEQWEWGFAVLVVAAVIVEFIIAGIHPPYDSFLEQWGTAVADAAIALGIVGEVLFGRKDAGIQNELRRRSIERASRLETEAAETNVRAAEAYNRAVRAELRLEGLRKTTGPATVNVQRVRDALRNVRPPKDPVIIEFIKTGVEARAIAMQLKAALSGINWYTLGPTESPDDDGIDRLRQSLISREYSTGARVRIIIRFQRGVYTTNGPSLPYLLQNAIWAELGWCEVAEVTGGFKAPPWKLELGSSTDALRITVLGRL